VQPFLGELIGTMTLILLGNGVVACVALKGSYGEKGGWIVISQMTAGEIAEPEGTFVGVWSIHDQGDVPPRWKIEGKPGNGMKKPHGIALDPKHKEVVVADMRLNAVLTFYFPEIF